MSRPSRRSPRSSGVVIAVVAAPIALAMPIQGGQRNPRSPNTAYSKQTQLWAANSAYRPARVQPRQRRRGDRRLPQLPADRRASRSSA